MQDSHDTLQTRYRPHTWQGIIGQDHIVSILRGIVRNKAYDYTRSYILAGGAGSGKTTTLRVLANAIICDNSQDGAPCLECQSCVEFANGQYHDYMEIDAGQYNKVDDISKLVEIAKVYPIHSNKPRIILLDESHRISSQGFDILLKILEDGNIRTIFMFATTEGDKIRPAIHSRSISLQVKPASVTEIRQELIRICEAEHIQYDTESIMSVAYANNGRMRDAIKTLDLYHRSQGSLTNIQIKSDNEHFCEILKLITLRKPNEAIDILDQMTTRKGLGNLLCDTLSALHCFPNNIISGVPEITLRNTKTLLDKSLRKYIEAYMQYKPDTYEQMKLFLLILAESNSSRGTTESTQKTKRQLFKNLKEKPKAQDDDEL